MTTCIYRHDKRITHIYTRWDTGDKLNRINVLLVLSLLEINCLASHFETKSRLKTDKVGLAFNDPNPKKKNSKREKD